MTKTKSKQGQIHGNSVAGGMGRSNKEKTAHNSEMLQRDNGRTDGRTYGQMDQYTAKCRVICPRLSRSNLWLFKSHIR